MSPSELKKLRNKQKKAKRKAEAENISNYCLQVFQDILKSLQVRYCIDLTPGDGAAALACYKMGIVCVGWSLRLAFELT